MNDIGYEEVKNRASFIFPFLRKHIIALNNLCYFLEILVKYTAV